jgi:peptidoglycan/xylan/chitin deacetylase (PgdA/CDA1 family)
MKQVILNFHGVGDPPPGTDPSERLYWWDQAAFNSLLDQICRAMHENDLWITITFDDGNMSDARIALPALARRGLTARFFVCAGRIGQKHYLDKPALADLLSAGMTIGSHGMHHVDWRRASSGELERETAEARQMLEDACACRVDEAAVPFGSYDRQVIAKLRRQNWRSVYTSDGGFAFEDAWIKPRNSLGRGWQHTRVVEQISGREGVWRGLVRSAAQLYKRMR